MLSLKSLTAFTLLPNIAISTEVRVQADTGAKQKTKQAIQWLQSITQLLASQSHHQPGYQSNPATGPTKGGLSLREASNQEQTLLLAIKKLAAYYGFPAKLYSLDKIQTMHSFSSNLEVQIPASTFSDFRQSKSTRLSKQEAQRWYKVQQSKRELVFLTAISGNSVLDIVTLLLLLEASAKQTPPLALRLVFLGSELEPKAMAQLKQSLPAGRYPRYNQRYTQAYHQEYPIGLRSFIYNYPLKQPYSLIYLYHGQQDSLANYSFSYNAIAPIIQGLAEVVQQRLLLLDRFNQLQGGNTLLEYWSFVANLSAWKQAFWQGFQQGSHSQATVQIMHHSSQSNIVAPLHLGHAFQSVQLPFSYGNGMQLQPMASYQRTAIRKRLRPFIEKQWPILALAQPTLNKQPKQGYKRAKGSHTQLIYWAQQIKQLAAGLEQFMWLMLEQALQAQQQSPTSDKIAAPADSSVKNHLTNSLIQWLEWLQSLQSLGPLAPAMQTKGHSGYHYWLWNNQNLWPFELGLVYISENQILLMLLLAILLFALFQLRWHTRLQQLQVLYGLSRASLIKMLLVPLTLLASYFVFAYQAQAFILKLVGHKPFSQLWLESLLPIEGPLPQGFLAQFTTLWAIILLQLNILLLFVYGFAASFSVDKRPTIWLLPYFSHSFTFIWLWLLAWQSFRLALLGLYFFALQSVYIILPKSYSRFYLLRILQKTSLYCVIGLQFVPSILLLISLPLPFALFGFSSQGIPSQALLTILFLPGLLLHYSQILYRRFYHGQSFYRYLLRHILLYILNILACVGLLYFGNQQSQNSPQKGKVHLLESYILQPQGKPKGPEGPSTAYQIWQYYSGNSYPSSLPIGQDIPPQYFQRPLTTQEISVLEALGQTLFSADGRMIQQQYSSILQLQAAVPLSHISVEIRGSKLLFANFPFTLPLPAGDTVYQGSYKSHLVMGFWPPAGQKIELLFAGTTGKLIYDIIWQAPSEHDSPRSGPIGDPIEKYLLPLVRKNTLSFYKRKEYSITEHTVVVRGLKLKLH